MVKLLSKVAMEDMTFISSPTSYLQFLEIILPTTDDISRRDDTTHSKSFSNV